MGGTPHFGNPPLYIPLWKTLYTTYLLETAAIHRVKRRHIIYGHYTIAILWIYNTA